MSDLLVKLYDLPVGDPPIGGDYVLRRPLAHERDTVLNWVGENFSAGWKSEVASAFGMPPVRCWIAVNSQNRIAGFACYDVTYRGFFGPTGVAETDRGKGVGTALLIRTLRTMLEVGYAYAVIGGASSLSYYQESVGAVEIVDSSPGAYPAALEGTD